MLGRQAGETMMHQLGVARSNRAARVRAGVSVVATATVFRAKTSATTREGEVAKVSAAKSAALELEVAAPDTSSSSVSMPLDEALARRRSVREYTAEPVGNEAISKLLWAAQGITDRKGDRTAPSAGALFPLEVYAVTARGVFHYEPQHRRLSRIDTADIRPALARAAHSQSAVRTAPLILAFAAVHSRTASKYGTRAERYVNLEAGHAAQNVLLEATALGLGAVAVGAFDDDALDRALSLPGEQRPVYLIAVGHPKR